MRPSCVPARSRIPLSKYLYDNLSPETQQLLASPGNEARPLRRSLAEDLNRLLERELKIKAAPERQEAGEGRRGSGNRRRQLVRAAAPEAGAAQRRDRRAVQDRPALRAGAVQAGAASEYLTDFIKENPQSWTRIRLNRLLLEAAYPKEIAHSLGGVYPDREIYTPTPDDSQRCFQEYMADAQRRMQLNQLKPGEDVKIIDNRVQVSGQVAVMNINGLLTKVIFDHNPKNEFFVEESFPLDWMYPLPDALRDHHEDQPPAAAGADGGHLRPRPPVLEAILQAADRRLSLITTRRSSTICDWIEKTYLRHDFNGFTGDRKFIHDDDAQKSFSKLRSSIGGIYAWRLSPQCPAEYRPKTNAEYQRLLKEADFTFRQAFAFCPYSPEAVFRYVQLLLQLQRFDDASSWRKPA